MAVFGQVMRDMRDAIGISQADLANRLGTTQRHVSFVENGRSAPTSYFVTRLCRELDLTLAQRANLFDAAGLPQAYPKRDIASDEVTAALDMIETRVLNVWPYPALVLDADYTIQRMNTPFRTLFASFLPIGNAPANLLDIMLTPTFRALVENWAETSELFYYRLQVEAARHDTVRAVFERAKAQGLFADLPKTLAASGQVPVVVPVRMRWPDGSRLQMTSLVGRLVAVQDALAEGFEVELFVPCDDITAQTLTG